MKAVRSGHRFGTKVKTKFAGRSFELSYASFRAMWIELSEEQ